MDEKDKDSQQPKGETTASLGEKKEPAPEPTVPRMLPELTEDVEATSGTYGQQPTSMARLLLVGALGVLIGAVVTWVLLHGESLRGTDVVAVVNGDEISMDEYEDVFEQVAASVGATSTETLPETQRTALRDQVMEILVNRTLLEQAAHKAGFTPTEEEVNTKYDELVAQAGGAEALAAIFEGSRLSEEVLREDIRRQIIIEDYIASTIEGDTLTLEEGAAREFYDEIDFGETEPIPFSDVEAQIEQRLLSQMQQEHVSALIETLREEAEIEIHI